jgi:hypothetical protein
MDGIDIVTRSRLRAGYVSRREFRAAIDSRFHAMIPAIVNVRSANSLLA